MVAFSSRREICMNCIYIRIAFIGFVIVGVRTLQRTLVEFKLLFFFFLTILT
jgi:disulfide bond formation protein DsbB